MTFAWRAIVGVFFGGLFASFFFLAPAPVSAQVTYDDIQDQGIIFAGICESKTTPCDCRDSGKCELSDILQVFVNISAFILGISGSVVLLMFVYGGVVWLTYGGNEGRVQKGKDILVGTVIGLAIIFGAYAAITVIVSALKTGALPEQGQNLEDVIGDAADGVIETAP